MHIHIHTCIAYTPTCLHAYVHTVAATARCSCQGIDRSLIESIRVVIIFWYIISLLTFWLPVWWPGRRYFCQGICPGTPWCGAACHWCQVKIHMAVTVVTCNRWCWWLCGGVPPPLPPCGRQGRPSPLRPWCISPLFQIFPPFQKNFRTFSKFFTILPFSRKISCNFHPPKFLMTFF